MKSFGAFLTAIIVFAASPVTADDLLVDFNSTTQDAGPHPEAGYQSYDAGHEVAADFDSKVYEVNFSSGAASITITPAWPNSEDARVRQSIDRGAGNDAQWLGPNLDLLTDWIGSDSREANGGNGDWDRTEATAPTYMTLTVEGLPAGAYQWLSFHHDTENMWSDFQVEISTDGGATYSDPIDMQSTSSSTGGNPAAPVIYTNEDPLGLPSTFSSIVDTDGANALVLRFAPFVDGVDPVQVHKRFFLMNGFRIREAIPVGVPATTSWGLFSLAALFLVGGSVMIRRRQSATAN